MGLYLAEGINGDKIVLDGAQKSGAGDILDRQLVRLNVKINYPDSHKNVKNLRLSSDIVDKRILFSPHLLEIPFS